MTLTFDDVTYTRDSGATRVNAAGLIVGVDFSTTSVTFGTGPQTFTLAADANVNRDWPIGSLVRATSQASPLGLMNGTVTSYDPVTQELVIEVTESTGTGTGTNWRIGSLEFRRDFDPVTLAPRGGLVEGGATNLIAQSVDFSNGYWQKSANCMFEHGLDFFGTSWATKVTPQIGQTTGADHIFRNGLITNINLVRHNKIYVKSDGVRYVALSFLSSFNANPTISAVYDLGTGQAVANPIYATGAGLLESEITNIKAFADGWWEISLASSRATPGYDQFRIGAASALSTNNVSTFTGNGVDGYLIALPHAENTRYRVQSIIPTTTVSVSRAADLLAVDGANFTQAYNQSQGTLLVECIPTESLNSSAIASINDGTLDNEIRVGQKQTGTRSSIRAIASDGVTDVMALNAAPNNVLLSNGVYLRETTNLSGLVTSRASLGVASSNLSEFVTVGTFESIRPTLDAGNSFSEKSISSSPLGGAHFGIGRFVIGMQESSAGASGVIVSTDGLSFRRINIAGLTQNLNEVTSNGVDQYVAVGNGGVIYTSSDAENWVAQVSGTATDLRGCHFFGGRYVAVAGLLAQSKYSDDGITWLSVSGLAAAYNDVYHNGTDLWVAVGSNGVISTSSDGITWTQQTSPVSTTLLGVHFADGLWVAVGASGTVVTSPDGITWTNRTATSGTASNINEVNFFNGKFYYAANGSAIAENTAAGIVAGTTWTLRTSTVSSGLIGIATNGSRLLICGTAGAIVTSDDGITFTSRTGNNATLNGAAFGNGTYVVVGNAINGSGLIATVDPVTFAYQRRVSGVNVSILSVRFISGVFYAAASSGRLFTSTDGITWSVIETGTTAALTDFASNGTVNVASGTVGVIRFATGLSGWASASGVPNVSYGGISHANGLFVAVGNSGTIITSSTGLSGSWTQRTSGTTANLFVVHYSTRDQQWYAAGDNGTILRSADAITWTSIANDAVGAVVTNGEVSVNPIAAKIIPNKRNRIALSWSSDGASLSVNGSVAALDPSLVMPIVDRITIGRSGDSSNFLNAPFKVLKTYKAKVSDTELQAITRI